MKTLFISDLHLDEQRPDLTEILIRFLRRDARSATSLYLLGDIFEVWVGDDDDSRLVAQIGSELRAVADAGVHTYFMHGNRDFLLGNAYAERAGMTLLADPKVMNLGGVPTLLSHGDKYCTTDVVYQEFRKTSRDPAWQQHMLSQPLAVRRAIAAKARQQSVEHQKALGGAMGEIVDVVEQEVIADLERAGVRRIIHGHTHRPAEHTLTLSDGSKAERIVLSDWRTTGEALEVHDDGSFERHVLR